MNQDTRQNPPNQAQIQKSLTALEKEKPATGSWQFSLEKISKKNKVLNDIPIPNKHFKFKRYMQITSLSPQNQAQIQKSLIRGKREVIQFIAYGDKAPLYEDKFYKSLPSEKKSVVLGLFKDMQPHERCIAQNIVMYLNSRQFDYRTNTTVATATTHSTGRVNKLYAKLVNAGLLNKVKPHKFGACVYALTPSLRDMSFRRILGRYLPVFKALCVGLLLSGIPKDSSCQMVMGRHIKPRKENLRALLSNIEDNVSSNGQKSLKNFRNAKDVRIATPGVCPPQVCPPQMQPSCAAQNQIKPATPASEPRFTKRIEGIYCSSSAHLSASAEDLKEANKLLRDTSEADKFARLNIHLIHKGKYKQLYELERCEKKRKRNEMLTPAEKRILSLPPSYKEKKPQQRYTPPSHKPYTASPRVIPHEDIYISYFRLQEHFRENGNPLNLPNPYRAKFIEMIEQSADCKSCANTGITKTQLKNELYKLYLATKGG